VLGLGTTLSKGGLATPSIVTDSLVLKHNYAAGGVVPVSDGAVSLNGTDEYIDLGSQANTTADFTTTAWVYLTVSQVAPVIAYGDFLVRFADATDLRVWGDVTGTSSTVTIDSVLNKWTHIAVSHDAGENKIYVNGVLVDTETDSASSTDARASYIGKYSAGYFEGYICNVGVWSRTMEIAEVKSIMNKNYAGLTSSEKTNLVSWWNLDEETATDGTAGSGGVKDHEGSNHGTLT